MKRLQVKEFEKYIDEYIELNQREELEICSGDKVLFHVVPNNQGEQR